MIIDAHAHIDRYAERLKEAIEQINTHHISTLAVSMDIPSYLKTIEIARMSPYINPTFGIHPWEAGRYYNNLEVMDQYLMQTPLIGEAGLDFHFIEDTDQYPRQRTVFEYQCEWAKRLGKPMNLHTKGAEEEVLSTLRNFNIKSSIIHWYSGPKKLIESYLSAGSYFTVGVAVLTSPEIQEITEIIPNDRLLLETDNPDGYQWITKSIGMPTLIYDVLAKVAQLKNINSMDLKRVLANNWGKISKEVNCSAHREGQFTIQSVIQ